MELNIEQLKYPIGKFSFSPTPDEPLKAIESIGLLPVKLKSAVAGLSESQLDTPYRDGGWTLRQVIHHLPDSHMNAYIRFKLALTEDNPEIRPYDETLWAECDDAKHGDIQLSLDLLAALHKKWVTFLKSLASDDLNRTYFHPANNKQSSLNEVLSMYVWHGEHHLAHIINAKTRNKW